MTRLLVPFLLVHARPPGPGPGDAAARRRAAPGNRLPRRPPRHPGRGEGARRGGPPPQARDVGAGRDPVRLLRRHGHGRLQGPLPAQGALHRRLRRVRLHELRRRPGRLRRGAAARPLRRLPVQRPDRLQLRDRVRARRQGDRHRAGLLRLQAPRPAAAPGGQRARPGGLPEREPRAHLLLRRLPAAGGPLRHPHHLEPERRSASTATSGPLRYKAYLLTGLDAFGGEGLEAGSWIRGARTGCVRPGPDLGRAWPA